MYYLYTHLYTAPNVLVFVMLITFDLERWKKSDEPYTNIEFSEYNKVSVLERFLQYMLYHKTAVALSETHMLLFSL